MKGFASKQNQRKSQISLKEWTIHKEYYCKKWSPRILNYLKEPYKKSKDCLLRVLIENAVWSVEAMIDSTDILSWINDRLEKLLKDGATEVNTIKGCALIDFIQQNQATGKYTEPCLYDLNTARRSVINVAMDNYGNILDMQMIRSKDGISAQMNHLFNGQPMIKIKINE